MQRSHTATLSALLMLAACASRRPPGAFEVVRAAPEYLLRSPDARETPFPEVLNRWRDARTGWVDLVPGMDVRVDLAHYREGSRRQTLADYLGSEMARFQVRPQGDLRLESVKSDLKQDADGRASAADLIGVRQRRYTHGRFFFTVAVNRKGQTRSAVLLGANSSKEIDRLTARLLADPESVCGERATQCTTFPETSTASIEIEITVNGAPQTVVWGTGLERIAAHPNRVTMRRLDRGRAVPVTIDASDPAALRLPLLPGDHIDWE